MPDVIVVGGGPAGLTCATQLARSGVSVVLLDRDEAMGGVPRYTDHLGYGLRDLRLETGPRYAHRLEAQAQRAGVDLRTRSTVTALVEPSPSDPPSNAWHAVDVTAPAGRERMVARAIVLATGCRERPRAARLIPGSRPSGVYTTAWLQRSVMNGSFRGSRAVIVGSEHVAYSAVLTLRHAGCRTVAMVTTRDRPETYPVVAAAARLRYRFPVLTRSRIQALIGQPALDGVVVKGPEGEQHLACDTLIVSGDWIAENELPRRAGLPTSDHRGALIAPGFSTGREGVFAAGNLLHPARTADSCARDGREAARVIAQWLAHVHA